MGDFYDEFNSVFWLSLATMVLGSFAVCLRYTYASKCEDISLLCGLIKIHRNIQAEIEADETKTNDETP
jgi:hypothetical protein